MDIQFFDDPRGAGRAREDVRIKQIGLFVYPDVRRMMFGIELTPFRERPSIDVRVRNGRGEPAGSLSVIETLTPNFSLMLHLRDEETINPYDLLAVLYYSTPETEPVEVDRQLITFSASEAGEILFKFETD